MSDEKNDIEELLEENLEVSKENNTILKKIYRSIKFGRVFNIIYWVVIIGIALGLFFFLDPYIQRVIDTVRGAQDVFDNTTS